MAAWKPKEKQLTPEEAVALARKELAPFWANSEPLIAAVRGEGGGVTVHPLDRSFAERAWLLFFADVTAYEGECLLQYARDWHKRYACHDLGFLLVVRPSYGFMETARAIAPLLSRAAPPFGIVLDQGGLLTEAFGAGGANMPKVTLFQAGKCVFERVGKSWHVDTELGVQRFLRASDPGLPLPLPFDPPENAVVTRGALELGGAKLPGGIQLRGKWAREAGRIVAQDAAATFSFRSPAARVSLIAQGASLADEPSRIRVELEGVPVFDAAAGQDLAFGDDGGSDIKIIEPKLYHALAALPAKARAVTFRFVDADRLPVALYGLRFGD